MRKVLITGASRGLGAVVARAFSEDSELILMARDESELEKVRLTCKNPSLHKVIPVDFLKMEKFVWSEQKPLDVVIHCAGGGLGMRGPFISSGALWELFMVNLGAAADINRFLSLYMKEQKRGYIIHVCSIASGEAIGSAGYNTVKAALAAYVRSLGRELAPYGVVVSGIAPGGFIANGNAMERLARSNPVAYLEFANKRLPRGFMGRAEELVPLIRLLTSPEGSMMGGCVVPIDAGEGRYY